MTDLEKEISRLHNLKQNKKKDSSDLFVQAQRNVWKKQISISDHFSVTAEKQQAEELFNAYLDNFQFNDFNEVTLVGHLVYEEILLNRVKTDINIISADENNKFISDKLIDSLHKIEDRVIELKIKLGISKTKEKDDLSAMQMLEKKLDCYIPFNRNEFTIWAGFQCSGCGKEDVKSFLLRRKVKDFEAIPHVAFYGRFLYNIEIFKDVEAGLITKEQAARYLRTSVYYIEWCIKNKNKIIQIPNVSKEQIDEFIKETPYLGKPEDYNEK